MATPIEVFVSYAEEDDSYRVELEKHLAPLVREGCIRIFHQRRVRAGEEPERAIAARLDEARIIVLLLSADYLASDACYELELCRAVARHDRAEACVIPILVRPCDAQRAPFAKLETLPRDGRAVARWPLRDDAWLEAALAVREAALDLSGTRPMPLYPDAATQKLSHELETARARKRLLSAHGADTADIDREILALRRQIREGGQLRAGDSLQNGRYLLLRPVGRGGFAIVWEAHDRDRDERVAVKVLHPNLAGDTIRRERFFRGARLMAGLEHEAVVRVREQHGEDGGYFYFVMEYIPGDDLRQAVLKKLLSPERLLDIVSRVAEAVAHAHRRGLVHRDIKPANILLDELDNPRLTDFDLVGALDTTGGTRTGAMGTVIYTAPEITDRPQDADARADVYSLGMTAIFGLRGAELNMLDVRRLDRVIDDLPVDEGVKEVLRRATDWEKEARYPDAGAFCEELGRALRGRDDEGLDMVSLFDTSEWHSARSAFEEMLTRWSGRYVHVARAADTTVEYRVEVTASCGWPTASLEVRGPRADLRLACAVNWIHENRVALCFDGYESPRPLDALVRGQIVLELESEDPSTGRVEFIWSGLLPTEGGVAALSWDSLPLGLLLEVGRG